MFLFLLTALRDIIVEMKRPKKCTNCRHRSARYTYACCQPIDQSRGKKYCYTCIKEQLIKDLTITVFYRETPMIFNKCPLCTRKNVCIMGPDGAVNISDMISTNQIILSAQVCQRICRDMIDYLNTQTDHQHNMLIRQVLNPLTAILNATDTYHF